MARAVAEGLLDENQRAEAFADTLRMRLVEEAGRREKEERGRRRGGAAAAAATATATAMSAGIAAGGRRGGGVRTIWSGKTSESKDEEEEERKSQEEVRGGSIAELQFMNGKVRTGNSPVALALLQSSSGRDHTTCNARILARHTQSAVCPQPTP